MKKHTIKTHKKSERKIFQNDHHKNYYHKRKKLVSTVFTIWFQNFQ